MDSAFFEVDGEAELLVENFSSAVLRRLRAGSFVVLRLTSLCHVYFFFRRDVSRRESNLVVSYICTALIGGLVSLIYRKPL